MVTVFDFDITDEFEILRKMFIPKRIFTEIEAISLAP